MKAIERLFIFFESKSLKHTPVERELGLTNGYLGKMRDRKGSIGSDILETIFCKFPELSPDWLLTGRGEMLYSQSSTPNQVTPPANNIAVAELKERIIELKDRITELKDMIAAKDELITIMREQLRMKQWQDTPLAVPDADVAVAG